LKGDEDALGLCSIAALDRPLAEVAAAAARAGLDGLEVTGRPPHLAPDDAAAAPRARAAVEAEGLRVLAYGSYFGLPDRRAPEQARRDVATARRLGAPRLRVWAACAAEDGNAMAPAVAALREVCDRAADVGIDVVLERHLGGWADTAPRVEALLAEVDRANFALNYRVLDLLPVEAAGEQVADAARLAGRARYMHVKNYLPPAEPGGRLRFGAGLAKGELDYAAILAAAVGAGFRGPIAIEFLAGDDRPLGERVAEDAAWLRRTWARLGEASAAERESEPCRS